MSIYVETFIRAPLRSVWTHTQLPGLHKRWDLRFTDIDYLPGPDPGAPQFFRYSTRMGLWLEIVGYGESVGHRDSPDGSSTSALSFGSSDRRSLILNGSGYWKYFPTAEGTTFITSYDYEPRWRWLGRIVDSFFFRPLLSWATAWSFDRLRIWLERNVDPESALRSALMHALTRVTLAVVFVYQGMVPKVLTRHPDELAMLAAAGVSPELLPVTVTLLGIAESALGLSLLFFWRARPPLIVALGFVTVATAVVCLIAPAFLFAAFNPISLNLAIAAIAGVGLFVDPEAVPSASRTLRVGPKQRDK